MKLISDLAPYPDLSSQKEYTASDYVQDGLISMWDGIENVSLGGVHDSSSAKWNDIHGGYSINVSGGAYWGDDCLVFTGGGISTGYPRPSTNIVTLEFVELHTTRQNSLPFQIQSGRQCALLATDDSYTFSQALEASSVPYSFGSTRSVSVELSSDGQIVRCHIDGEDVTSQKKARVSNVEFSGMRMGGATDTYMRFSGKLHAVRCYSRALSPAEVAANYEIDKARFHLEEGPLSSRLAFGGARDEKLATKFLSDVSSRARGLLALRAQNWVAVGNSEEEMYRELFQSMVMGYYQNRGGTAVRDIMPDIVDDTITNVRPYAFQYCCIGNISLPNCTRIEGYGFYGAWSGSASTGEGKVINLPNVTTFGGSYPFQGIAGGSEVHLDSLTSLSQNIITGSSYYIAWFFPKVTSITASNWNYASSWRELHLDSMTMDDVMASPGWPWGGMTAKYLIYPIGTCYCSDGYITYENGAWTKHPT